MRLRSQLCGGHPSARSLGQEAFSLLEVMLALAVFFMAIFAILGSVSQSLGAARMLQLRFPDPSPLVMELMLTNRLEEGIVEDTFGDLYPGFGWTREIEMVATNGLFRVDFTLRGTVGKKPWESQTSLLLWRPDSQQTLTAGPGRRR